MTSRNLWHTVHPSLRRTQGSSQLARGPALQPCPRTSPFCCGSYGRSCASFFPQGPLWLESPCHLLPEHMFTRPWRSCYSVSSGECMFHEIKWHYLPVQLAAIFLERCLAYSKCSIDICSIDGVSKRQVPLWSRSLPHPWPTYIVSHHLLWPCWNPAWCLRLTSVCLTERALESRDAASLRFLNP